MAGELDSVVHCPKRALHNIERLSFPLTQLLPTNKHNESNYDGIPSFNFYPVQLKLGSLLVVIQTPAPLEVDASMSARPVSVSNRVS